MEKIAIFRYRVGAASSRDSEPVAAGSRSYKEQEAMESEAL
ncbi:hypothetical protein [Desulforhabdus sp. TSK]|nr:hypothetical protein [Desulforhabdus sp. TSK]GKT09311.1 hypothetical protein DSTSK_26160 [Desulforhabdus sp. TSK]